MVDVFISYARRDRAKIEALANALEGEGYSVWWDHRIAGGAEFAAEIERALNGAKSVIVAWSINAVQSEWVIDEASLAKRDGKLVPIRLDATHPPIGFRQYQDVDFSNWKGARNEEPFAALMRSVSRYLRRGVEQPSDDLIEERAQSGYSDTIAVLPLENLTGDLDQQFLVDGMHEALITNLSKIGSLKVISRTSCKRYAGSDKSAREIGAELGVSKLVEGSVMRAGDDIRVTVQLIDSRSDTHLWAESFDQDMTNVLKLQSEVASAIVEKISVVLTPLEQSRLTAAPSVSTDAYEAYLKGMYHWYKLSPDDMQTALKWFDTALASDPDYAPAYAAIGMIWAGIQQMGVVPPSFATPKIKTAADKAMELDPGFFQAHFTRAAYLTWAEWNWIEAEPAYQRAIELNPNFPDTHAYYSHYLNIVGRFDEAEAAIDKALNLDPFNPLIRSLYCVDLMFWGRYEECIKQCKIVLNATPDHWLPMQVARNAYHLKGMQSEALSITRDLYALLDKPSVIAALDRGAKEGGYEKAMAYAAEALAAKAEKSYISPTQIAFLYGMGAEYGQAALWIERAFEARDPDLPYQKYFSRLPAQMLNDPRVKAVIEKLNYPPRPHVKEKQ